MVDLKHWTRTDRKQELLWPQLNPSLRWMTRPASEHVGVRRNWAIVSSGKTIGRIGLRSFEARIGIYIRPDAWGRGYATEALQEFLPIAFSEVGLGKINADVAAENERSLRLFRNAGFIEVSDEMRDGHLFFQMIRTQQ